MCNYSYSVSAKQSSFIAQVVLFTVPMRHKLQYKTMHSPKQLKDSVDSIINNFPQKHYYTSQMCTLYI